MLSTIIGPNDESFSIAVCIDAKGEFVLGKMLGDADDQPSACNRSAVISQHFTGDIMPELANPVQ
jgi:hypothetical protein